MAATFQSEVDKRGYYDAADIARIKREDPKGAKRFADVARESAAKKARPKRAAKKKRN